MAVPRRPRAGTVESMVKHMVERGKSVLDIVNRVQGKFNTPAVAKVSEYITRWAEYTGRSMQPASYTPLSDRQRADLAQTGLSSGYSRRTVWVDWVNPKDGNLETKSWYVDVPHGLKGQKETDYIYNRLAGRIMEHYQTALKTEADLARFVYSVRLEND